VRYLCFDAHRPEAIHPLGAHSSAYALFERTGTALQPVVLDRPDRFDDDLVSIPKYPGKTNEQFTRLMINVTTAAVWDRDASKTITVLDPMCGRGTTLSTAWTLGHHAAGVESDAKAVELYTAFLKTYLRRKRYKHTVDTSPVRRDGKSLGKRLDATVRPDPADEPLTLSVFTGDTRQSAALWGKRRFDVIVCDAPYGVVHQSSGAGGRERSPADLLAESLRVWVSQLTAGGAIGLSWNTLGLNRERLAEMLAAAGAQPLDHGPWLQFGHRVDSSIHRDLIVAVRD
jgi:tRNA G10  N-methylase Trm11